MGRAGRLAVAAATLVALAAVPTLRADADARTQAWERRCVAGGDQVFTEQADTANPLVVHTGHPVLTCVSASGVVVSVRD